MYEWHGRAIHNMKDKPKGESTLEFLSGLLHLH